MSSTAATDTTTPDLAAVKERQQATWASGDYSRIGTTLQIVGEQLCETLDLAAGWSVLDVAAGNGNVALAAARRGCDVLATDYVPELLELAAARAAAEAASIRTEVADAEALPYDDGSFDAVVSTFGVMFTPDHRRSSSELLRVCRAGGRIGVANWTPEGFIGQMFKIVGSYAPPPAGVASPLLWGTEAHVEELLGGGAAVTTQRRSFVFRYRSAEDMVDTFLSYYGPTFKAAASLDADGRAAFRADLLAHCEAHRSSANPALAISSEYLETVAVRTA